MMCKYYIARLVFIFAFAFLIFNCDAQTNSAARYEVDAKRIGLSMNDKDALPRSREFIRLDNTYYVGWMMEGTYKFNHSSDYLGYTQASLPLRKALSLLEKDYATVLKTVYNSPTDYTTAQVRYADFLNICANLKTAYENTERADSAMWVLDRVESYKFAKAQVLDPLTSKAWIYHRNRYFTSAKYSFLKNTIAENEHLAKQYCYNALGELQRNESRNIALFGVTVSDYDKIYAWHNLAIVQGYTKQYDSAEYYYRNLINTGYVSYNNYGNLQMEQGFLARAYDYISRDKYSYNNNLEEPYYFLPMLDVLAGRTKQAIQLGHEIISQRGSVPGFGWYNIALARSYMYDGQLDSCEVALNKAQNFKEVHIGTTLTQEQYDFTINLLRFQLLEKKIAQIKFFDPGYWYSFTNMSDVATLEGERYMLQYVLVNQMMANPERERIIYDLFCGESTISFDETWCLLKDFSPAYFEKKYAEYPNHDKRSELYRYFKFFETRFEAMQSSNVTTLKKLELINSTTRLDAENEKLFIARMFESLCIAYDKADDDDKKNLYANYLFEQYPQLLPFTGIKINMQLNNTGVSDATTQNIIDEIEDCGINFNNNATVPQPNASVSFVTKSGRYEATINVTGANGKTIVSNEKLVFKPGDEGVGKELALRLFGKGGARVYSTPPKPE